MSTARAHNLRLVGLGGSNKMMAGELSRLAGRAFDHVQLPEPKKQGLGSLVYPFDPDLAALAVRYHRTSARVLWDVYCSKAPRLEPLYADLLQQIVDDDRGWASDGQSFSVSAYNVDAFAAGERQIVGTVKNALIDGFGKRGVKLSVNPERPNLHVGVRLYDEGLYVSLDLAGRPMHQRGYRQNSTLAPLREDLAALLVMWGRYDARNDTLVDPMAGSGTIAIEAASMARARPVWMSGRRPAAENLPQLATQLQTRAGPLFGDTQPRIFVAEKDPAALRALDANLDTAGCKQSVQLVRGDFSQLDAAQLRADITARGGDADRGLIVTNPPYGERLQHGARELEQLYRRLGDWCHQFAGWRAALLVANPDFERAFGGRPRKKKPMNNGPLRGFLYLYDLG